MIPYVPGKLAERESSSVILRPLPAGSVLLLACAELELARFQTLFLPIVSDVLINYDVQLLLLLLFISENHVEHLEGHEEGSEEQEHNVGEYCGRTLLEDSVTNELRDPAEQLKTHPHLKSVAAEQVLLSVEVADHDCNLARHEATNHGRSATDHIDIEVEAADDKPSGSGGAHDELAINLVRLLLRIVTDRKASLVFPRELEMAYIRTAVERAKQRRHNKRNEDEMNPHVCVVIMETAVFDVEVLESETRLVSRERIFLGYDDHFLAFNTVRSNIINLF